MDISQTTKPRSDQMNADDVTIPVTVTIRDVRAGNAEQPVEVHVDGYEGRPYKPGKSMRRVLVALWGPEASAYVGRRLTLFNDQTIRFGKEVTGGIRISHASHIDKPLTIPLTVTRGRRAPFTVQPLPDAPVPADQVSKAVIAVHGARTVVRLDEVVEYARKLGIDGAAELVAAIEQKRGELGAGTDHTDGGKR